MKTTIVYYSKSGNTKKVAEILSESLQVSSLEIKPQNDVPSKGFLMYFLGGMGVVFKRKPKLQPYEFNNESELVIIGSPIWASSFCPAVRTFLTQNNLSGKKVAFFSCSMGGNAGKCFEEFKKLQPNCELVSTCEFLQPLDDPNKTKQQAVAHWIEKLKLIYERV